MKRYDYIFENFEPFYIKALSDISRERNIDVEKFEKLKKSDTLRLVALTPFLADADYAEMFAYANLSVLLTAANFPEIFKATESLCLETRATLILENIRHFVKNRKIFKLCQKALIAISYKDHLHDIENDKKIGKYNPLNSDKKMKKYEKLFKKIFKELDKETKINTIIDLKNLFINNPGFWLN